MIAVRELGGEIIEPPADVAFGGRESVEDVARNLERWVAGTVVRTFAQSRLEVFARAATRMRVVNALTDEEHPCQALADIMTLGERLGPLPGRTVAFVGDGNNVAVSLAHACSMAGMHLKVASPAGFELPASVVSAAASVARHGGDRDRPRTIRSRPSRTRMRSTPTPGRRWARKRKPRAANWPSRTIR